jgi:hypothetical protein
MKKKYISGVVVILALIAGGFFFLKNTAKGVYEMDGRIVHTGLDGSILVEGQVGGKTKSLGFIMTDKTIYNKATLTVTKEQIASKGQFIPTREVVAGSKEDLKTGLQLIIHSDKNLLTENPATATSVDYGDNDIIVK